MKMAAVHFRGPGGQESPEDVTGDHAILLSKAFHPRTICHSKQACVECVFCVRDFFGAENPVKQTNAFKAEVRLWVQTVNRLPKCSIFNYSSKQCYKEDMTRL